MKKLLSIICLAAALLCGCSKEQSNADPCENLLSQMAPERVTLKFVDKTTGESLTGTAGFTKESISVTDVATAEAYVNWGLVNDQNMGLGGNLLGIVLFPKKAGDHLFRIKLGDKGEAMLKFKVTQRKGSGPCGYTYFTTSDFNIADHEYSYFEHQNREYKTILIVKI